MGIDATNADVYLDETLEWLIQEGILQQPRDDTGAVPVWYRELNRTWPERRECDNGEPLYLIRRSWPPRSR